MKISQHLQDSKDDYPGFQQIPGMPTLLQHSVCPSKIPYQSRVHLPAWPTRPLYSWLSGVEWYPMYIMCLEYIKLMEQEYVVVVLFLQHAIAVCRAEWLLLVLLCTGNPQVFHPEMSYKNVKLTARIQFFLFTLNIECTNVNWVSEHACFGLKIGNLYLKNNMK